MKKTHIGKSIFRDNVGFSFGLFFMYAVMIVLVFFSLLLPGSLRSAVDDFITDYKLENAWITAMPMYDPPIEKLKKINNVCEINQSFTTDVDIKINGEDGFSARIFSVSDDDTLMFHTYSEDENATPDSVSITYRFATLNSVSPGDTVTVEAPNGNTDLKIGRIITTPEGIICSKDDLAQSDAYSFCYLYLPRDEVDRIFGTNGLSNRFSIWFDDGTTTEEMQKAVKEAEDILGESVISSVVFETSQFKSFIDCELDSLDSAIRYMLYIIFFIGICFSCFFVYQIIDKERKTIGLLRALGYSKSKIFAYFFKYIGGLSVSAAIAGGIAGICLVRLSAGVYLKQLSIPDIAYIIPPLPFVKFFSMYFISVFLSCVLSSGKITGIDPCEAYGGVVPNKGGTSGLVSRLKLPVFAKISVTSLSRHIFRLLATALCISVCIMLTMMSVSTKTSEQNAIPATFGDKFRYDVSLRVSGDDSVLQDIKDNENTEKVNECISFRGTLSFNGKTEYSLFNALKDDHSLFVLYDPSGNSIDVPENGILLNLLSVSLGIIIIYNMVMLSANEKRVEYATLLALGIKTKEIFTMAFFENILEYIPAVILAIPLGVFSSLRLMFVMCTQAHAYPTYLFGASFAASCTVSLIYIFVGVLLTIIKVKRIDPALSLNFGE